MTQTVPGVGLHVSDSHICVARMEEGGRVQSVTEPAALRTITTEDLTKLNLSKSDARYAGQALLLGDNAAESEKVELSSPGMATCGRMDLGASIAEYALGVILEKMLGPAVIPAETCVYAVPSPLLITGQELTFQLAILEDILRKLGYSPVPLKEGTALALAELSASNNVYSANSAILALSCGEKQLHGCLNYRGIVGIDFSTEPGGDWVDSQVGMALNKDMAAARQVRKDVTCLTLPQNRSDEAILIFCKQYLGTIIKSLKLLFEREGTPILGEPVDVVWAGTWLPSQGFGDLMLRMANDAELSIPLGIFRITGSPKAAVAQGCLKVSVDVQGERAKLFETEK